MKSLKALLFSAAIFLPPSLQALTLQWEANLPVQQITSYEIDIYVASSTPYHTYVNVGNVTQYTINPVSNAVTTYYIRAINATGTSPWSLGVNYDPSVPFDNIKTSSFSVVVNPTTQAKTTTLNLSGTPALAFSVQTSEDLLTWLTVFTGQIGANGTYSFQNTSTKSKLFYRAKYTQ